MQACIGGCVERARLLELLKHTIGLRSLSSAFGCYRHCFTPSSSVIRSERPRKPMQLHFSGDKAGCFPNFSWWVNVCMLTRLTNRSCSSERHRYKLHGEGLGTKTASCKHFLCWGHSNPCCMIRAYPSFGCFQPIAAYCSSSTDTVISTISSGNIRQHTELWDCSRSSLFETKPNRHWT